MAMEMQEGGMMGGRTRQTVVLLLASTSPALFLAQLSQYMALPLDNLHIVLIQLLALLTLWDFSYLRKSAPVPVITQTAGVPKLQPDIPSSGTSLTGTKYDDKAQLQIANASASSSDADEPIYDHPRYPATFTYSLVGKFLKVLRPALLDHLPSTYHDKEQVQDADSWAPLVNVSSDDPLKLQVEQSLHTAHLYKVVFELPHSPDVVFNFLGDSSNRQLWDSMCTGVRLLERIAPPPQASASTNRISVEYISLKAIWPTKARDMVILSHRIRLPSADSQGPGRLICATTSVDHPDAKEGGSHARLRLGLAGYICELSGSSIPGMETTRVEQVTDLSGVGSFAPASLVRMITTKMVPQSIAKMAAKLAEQQATGSDSRPELTVLPLTPLSGVRTMVPLVNGHGNGLPAPDVASQNDVKPSVDSRPIKRESRDTDAAKPRLSSSMWQNILPDFLQISQGTLGVTIGSSIGAAFVYWGLSQWTKYRR